MHSTDLRQAMMSQSVQQNLKLSVFQFLRRKMVTSIFVSYYTFV